MVKSFINAFFGGIGRTLGKIVVYIIIALIFFFIYENANAAAIYSANHSCNSTYYNIEKMDGTATYGQTSTSYNISWAYISFSGTENLKANTYYDLVITFRSNISNNIFNDTGGDNEGIRGMHLFQTSSLCGNHNGEASISSYGISGSKLTVRILTGPSLFDYWEWYQRFTFVGSNGINTVTFTEVDTTGASGIIENNNNNTNNIINNNNTNTQDIINNNNQNTQDIIDSQNELLGNCLVNNNISLNVGSISVSSGNWYQEYDLSNFVSNFKQGRYYWGFTASSIAYTQPIKATLLIFYSDNTPYQEIDVTTGENNKYQVSFNVNSDNVSSMLIRFLRPVGSSNAFNRSGTFTNIYIGQVNDPTDLTLLSKTCSSKLDDTNQAIGDLNDSINDTSDADTSIFTTWFSNFNPASNPLGNVITLPITLAQKIVGFNSNSCADINLGTLLGKSIVFHCFTLYSVLPQNASTMINTIDIIMSISLIVVIIKNTYETIANLVSLGGENEVKKQFRLPTPLEFLSGLFNGGGN